MCDGNAVNDQTPVMLARGVHVIHKLHLEPIACQMPFEKMCE